MADYQRQAFAFIVQAVLIVLAHGFFFVLTRPTQGNHSFPYHVKTNKIINVQEKTDEQENYNHHLENKGGNLEFETILPANLKFSDLLMSNRSGVYQSNNMSYLVF